MMSVMNVTTIAVPSTAGCNRVALKG
jgi:hypothetical protein